MAPEFASGERFGYFELDVHIGGGGSGSVWRARDLRTGQVVALKVIQGSTDGAARAEIELLAATASQRSSHVVKVFAGGTDPVPHLAMEYVDGADYAELLAERGRLSIAEVLAVGIALADALAALHAVGIVHRDIKPGNVMRAADGTIKLTDFGVAQIEGLAPSETVADAPMTMAYAAPEVWNGRATHQSDLYAFGCVLYECLAGRPVFTGSVGQLYAMHHHREADLAALPSDTPPMLRALVAACLAKASEDRPPAASECLILLRAVADPAANIIVATPHWMGVAQPAKSHVPDVDESNTTRRPVITFDAPARIEAPAVEFVEARLALSSAAHEDATPSRDAPPSFSGMLAVVAGAIVVLAAVAVWLAPQVIDGVQVVHPAGDAVTARTSTVAAAPSVSPTPTASAWQVIAPGALQPTHTAGLGWNPNDPIMRDVRVIQALTQSTTVNQTWSPNVALPNGEFDEANARASLIAAGYDTCPAPAKPLSITLMLVDDRPSNAIADALEADWKQHLCIGVTRLLVGNLRAGANADWQIYIYD